MSIKESILGLILALIIPLAHAEAPSAEPPAEEGMSEEQFVASLNFRKGVVTVGDGLATLRLPPQLVFLDSEDSRRVLEDAWGNPPADEPPLGMILPAGISPLAEESWAVTVEFERSGYVTDEDAAEIDFDDMLKDMQSDTREHNAWREENGYEPIELIGWAATPRYDSQGKKLYWAKQLQFGDADVQTLNYNIRVLGRNGVLVLNFIANMDQLPEIERNVPSVLEMTDFNPGHRYAEFDPDIDEVAAYGIGALIAGKVAAKTGLLAMLLLLLKKFWIIPVLAFGWIGRRLFNR